jgi:dolichyl-phosphate beta-glucosyltransferase
MKENMMSGPLDLSIVIPAYNEEHRLPPYLVRILAYLEAQHLSYEVIIVDDGSRDGTAALLQENCGFSPTLTAPLPSRSWRS